MVKKSSLIILLALLLSFICGCVSNVPSKGTMVAAPTVSTTTATALVGTPEHVSTSVPVTTSALPSAASLHSTGGYYMNEWYNLSRVSKYAKTAVVVYITAYRYQFRDSYRYWDTVATKWLPVDPPRGSKFLFVFVNTWLDTSAGNVSPIDGFDYTHFKLQYNGALLPGSVDLHQIYELQTYSTLFKTGYVTPFGYQWITNSITLKRKLSSLNTLEGGKGNAWDGFIIYTVPQDTKKEDLMVVGNFAGMGSAYWIFQGADSFSLD